MGGGWGGRGGGGGAGRGGAGGEGRGEGGGGGKRRPFLVICAFIRNYALFY
ncbi:MAG: hypothetical protein IPL21_07900 [Saprospirales bacterium]|nr:hypothetical protein [Saprospirales bacterium]